MEIVNKKYIRVKKSDIFVQELPELYDKSKERQLFFEDMVSSILNSLKDPEGKGRRGSFIYIDEVYIPIESIRKYDFFEEQEFYVTKSTVVNATLFALINGEIETVLSLMKFLLKDKTFVNELGECKDYVLEHNININDYLNEEREKYIYNPIDKSINKGFIHSKDEIDNVKKLSRF